MLSLPAYTLVNTQTSNLDFRIFYFDSDNAFNHLQRLNYFSLVLIETGSGTLKADFSTYEFNGKTLMCFTPYQPFMIKADKVIRGVTINFHSDFFCIHKHRKEVSCNGVLFNDLYHPPMMELNDKDYDAFKSMIEPMQQELQEPGLAQYEMLLSYLKIFLINASRIKLEKSQAKINTADEPPVLQKLKDSIEEHFKTKHSPSEYSEMLNISAKALGKITKSHFNRTLTDMISERIIMEAKRELYLSNKTVKEIAYELGFGDEHYFSRFFKNNAEVSPQMYRENVGYGRG